MPYVVPTSEYKRQFRGNVVVSENGQLALPEEWDYEAYVPPEYADLDEIERRQKELIGVSPSMFTEFAVKMPDKKAQQMVSFSFAGRRYLKIPYDSPAKRRLFKCGRQVEKSTLLGNMTLSYCCIINSFTVLYVSPTNAQAKVFSRDRLKEPMETSDILKAWTTTKLSDNVFEKQFINRSKTILRYAYHNADRTRGIPADMILLDEIQDILTDNIPVIEECASHSPYKVFVYSGTPKSLDNSIEAYWAKHSTQNEWVVPCEHHGVPGDPSTWHWNVLSEDHIGIKGLICDKCGEIINSMHPMAQWCSMNPRVRRSTEEGGLGDKAFEGFRIPQLMVPWLKWDEILVKKSTYPRGQFYNEVLGLSYDSGTRPLTRQDVLDNCKPGLLMSESSLAQIKRQVGQGNPVFAGIDWGTGENSFTVMTLAAYIDGKFTVFYMHRFEGQETEPQVQLEIIEKLMRGWDVDVVGVDYGGGFDRNDAMQRRFGTNKVWKYQYATVNQKVRWEAELRRFLVNRTEVMSDIFNAVKRKDVFRFPDWAHFESPFAEDFLAIFSEYNEQTRQIQYKHAPDHTDDAFHSFLLCFLVSMMKVPRFDVLNPQAKVSTGFEEG